MMPNKFFRHEVEVLLRVALGAMVTSAFLVTLAWGYEQRKQAQGWRETACAYRVADLAKSAPFVARDTDVRSACGRLDALGVSLQTY